jgi:hypothetical protein
MYIPSLFSTSQNGCPSGFNAYRMGNFGTTNLNSGARGRITVTINQFTNDIVGENYQGLGSYTTDIQLGNGGSTSANGIEPPSIFNPGLVFWGTSGQNPVTNYYITSSAGNDLYYCYDCTRKWRYTIGSRLCQNIPWPSLSTPLRLAVLTNPTGSINNLAHYTSVNFDFCIGTTGSIEGFGPIWYNQSPGSPNQAGYYIVSREDITPRYYNVQNCLTSSVTASISLSGSVTLNVGDVFKSSTSTLSGSCWSVTDTFQSGAFTPNISNVVTASTFAACINCTDPLSIKYNITDCDTSTNYIATFSSAPTFGSIFKSNDLGKCFTIVSQATQSLATDYSNLSIVQTYADCPTCLATSGSLLISSLVVGGGGAGGGYGGGGGGGGEYEAPSNVLIATGSTYPVVVGEGGIAAGFYGTNGGSSSFNGVVAIGGGAGGAYSAGTGVDGASGGGGSYFSNGVGGIGTAGNNGGNGFDGTLGDNQSAGGGGSSQVGANGTTTSNGGNGNQWLDGNYYAGGGGGYRREASLSSIRGIGGLGGGGNGYQALNPGGSELRVATSGSANTGGGGGGSAAGLSPLNWDGGSGIVKIRYAASSSLATGGTITISGSYVYHTFTGSGNFVT